MNMTQSAMEINELKGTGWANQWRNNALTSELCPLLYSRLAVATTYQAYLLQIILAFPYLFTFSVASSSHATIHQSVHNLKCQNMMQESFPSFSMKINQREDFIGKTNYPKYGWVDISRKCLKWVSCPRPPSKFQLCCEVVGLCHLLKLWTSIFKDIIYRQLKQLQCVRQCARNGLMSSRILEFPSFILSVVN